MMRGPRRLSQPGGETTTKLATHGCRTTLKRLRVSHAVRHGPLAQGAILLQTIVRTPLHGVYITRQCGMR